jgi:methyl-accepting chemotaxis protein
VEPAYMGDFEEKNRNLYTESMKTNKRHFVTAIIVVTCVILVLALLTLIVSRFFVLFVIPGALAGCIVCYFIYRQQGKIYADLLSDYQHMEVHVQNHANEVKETSLYEQKYNTLVTLMQSSQDVLTKINDQIKEYISQKKSELESITGDQKGFVHDNMNILKEIKNKSTTFFSENNIVKELIKNIAEKVDSEIGFSRNTLDRLKNLFNIIKEIIKASEILYKNSEFLVSIMQTIENISNKIHVLSINASVIAARAGEAGKAFMVVAKEVRNLSDNVKQSVDEMKNNSEKLKTSIDDVTKNIQEIESETKTTYDDMENLLMRFEGLNLSINIIDKKVISNMDIIKNFEGLIQTNMTNTDNYIVLLDSIDMDGLTNALMLIDQVKGQCSLFFDSSSPNTANTQ